jgi:ABC-type amino acid transport substrate-binding protein
MKIKTITPGILTVATFLGFPPVVFKDNNGEFLGTDVQYLIKFGKQHNLKVKFIEEQVFDGLWKLPGKNKIYDIAAAGISPSKLRENESPGTTWSNAYYNVQRSFITLIENSITKIEDLSGKTVTVKKKSTGDLDLLEHIRKYNVQNLTIQYSDNIDQSIQLVLEGKVFAIGSGLLTNQYIASKYSNVHVQWIHDMLLPSGEIGSEFFSFPTRTKSEGLVEALNKFIKENTYDTNVIPVPAPAPIFYDQVVKGNVYIKQLSKNKYKITFRKVDNFLKYQVWSDSSKNLNERRIEKAKLWIQNFNLLNANLKKLGKPLFTPTTVMEIGNNKYVFVLDKAKLNCKDRIVFNVSTKEIVLLNGTSKKMLKIPCEHHDGVRFDIDIGWY